MFEGRTPAMEIIIHANHNTPANVITRLLSHEF